MMTLKQYILTLLIIPIMSFGQVATKFTGSAMEENTFNPVSSAIISIEGTKFATDTDEQGQFEFNELLPTGEHIVTVTKDGYETKYFIVKVINGVAVVANNIVLELTKAEKKSRKKAEKNLSKQQKAANKEKDKKLKEARKAKEKEDKRLAKERKKLGKKGNKSGMIIDYKAFEEAPSEKIPKNPDASPIQEKYAALLNVVPNNIVNTDLYIFIDEWMKTPYRMGGSNKEGIDCSSFSQMLYSKVYDIYIERTAETQFFSKHTDKFEGREFLHEGDLVFFKQVTDQTENISHVGIYLQNNMFVHAASNRDKDGNRGVQISNIKEPYWVKKFVAGGRRIVK